MNGADRAGPLRAGASALLALVALGVAPAAAIELPVVRLHASDVSPGQRFGESVSVDGDRLLAGALGTGAYVFEREEGVWVERAKLVPSGGAVNQYAAAVSLSGNRALVGSSTESGGGAAYVFVESGGTWTQEARLTPSVPVSSRFGYALSLEGDRAVIGAPWDGVMGLRSGAAHVFERVDGVWVETQKLFPDVSVVGAEFGQGVELHGDDIVVGAPFEDATYTRQGAAYVFTLGGGDWSQEARLVDDGANGYGYLGVSLSMDGDRLLAGAWGDGTAVVFEREGTGWEQRARLERPSGVGYFGHAVALRGDRAAVGAYNSQGAVALYTYAQGGWNYAEGIWDLARTERPTDGCGSGECPRLGYSISFEGDCLVAGAFSDDGPQVDTGGVYAYDVSELAFFTAAVGLRNGGTNPLSYAALPVYVGGTLRLSASPLGSGHDLAAIVAFDSPFESTLPGGQTLLCIDTGGNGLLLDTGFVPPNQGPLVSIEVAVPNDPRLAGLEIFSQAVYGFGTVPFALSNAQDILIGGSP